VIVFRASADGGRTWGPDRFFPLTQKPQNDPQIEMATDGTIYAVWLDDYRPGVKFIKSADHGVTWSEPIAFTGRGNPARRGASDHGSSTRTSRSGQPA
jgi:hypothetical protein